MELIIDNFNDEYGNEYREYYLNSKEILKGTNPSNKKSKYELLDVIYKPIDAIAYIQKLYEDGYGLKVLGRHLDMSYTMMRCSFKKFGIPMRVGRAVSTEKTRTFRQYKALQDDNPWKNWTEHHPEWGDKSRTGISGYYISASGDSIWLRSTWEYIYAKWLDINNISWKFENITYELSDGTSYRPDFFIYDNGKLSHIVEIKGYYDNRAYKPELLMEEYSLNVVVITDMSPYIQTTYYNELQEWKEYINKGNKYGN